MSRLITTRSALSAALVVGCFLLYLPPWVPSFPSLDSADVDFGLVLSHAFNRGWQFGLDIVYTFGPYGFVYDNLFDPGTYGLKLTIWFLLALVVGLSVVAILDFKRPVASLLAVAVFFLGVTNDPNAFFYVSPLLFGLVFFHPDPLIRRWLVGPLLILCAFISLIKFTFLVLSVAFILLIEGYRLTEKRFIPLVLLSYIVSTLSFFWLAGQDLKNFGEYLQSSMVVAGGYSEAMQRFGDIHEVVAFLMAASSLIALSVFAARRVKRSREDVALLLAIAWFCFMIFKAGFTRHDVGHSSLPWGGIACAAVLVYLARVRHASGSISLGNCTIGIGFLVLLLAGSWKDDTKWGAYPKTTFINQLPERTSALTGFVAHGSSFRDRMQHLTQEYEDAMAEIRSETGPVEPFDGNVDIYPWGAALVFAHELPYKPRPAFQSFAAYNETLLGLNRDYLIGDGAPDALFFRSRTIDLRYLSQNDGLSWPAIISRYEPTGSSNYGYALWKKRSVARQVTVSDSSTVSSEVTFMESIVPPADWERVWVSISLEKTLFGRLFDFLFKSPRIEMAVTLADGRYAAKRIVPALARSGFLLTPLLDPEDDLAMLLTAKTDSMTSASTRVAKMQLMSWRFGENISWFYRDRIQVTFRRLLIGGGS